MIPPAVWNTPAGHTATTWRKYLAADPAYHAFLAANRRTPTEWRQYLADVALVCMVAATVDDRTPDEDAALSRLIGGVS
jgi:hypothetical protein